MYVDCKTNFLVTRLRDSAVNWGLRRFWHMNYEGVGDGVS